MKKTIPDDDRPCVPRKDPYKKQSNAAAVVIAVVIFVGIVSLAVFATKARADDIHVPATVLAPPQLPFTGGILFDCKPNPIDSTSMICVVRTVSLAERK